MKKIVICLAIALSCMAQEQILMRMPSENVNLKSLRSWIRASGCKCAIVNGGIPQDKNKDVLRVQHDDVIYFIDLSESSGEDENLKSIKCVRFSASWPSANKEQARHALAACNDYNSKAFFVPVKSNGENIAMDYVMVYNGGLDYPNFRHTAQMFQMAVKLWAEYALGHGFVEVKKESGAYKD